MVVVLDRLMCNDPRCRIVLSGIRLDLYHLQDSAITHHLDMLVKARLLLWQFPRVICSCQLNFHFNSTTML